MTPKFKAVIEIRDPEKAQRCVKARHLSGNFVKVQVWSEPKKKDKTTRK